MNGWILTGLLAVIVLVIVTLFRIRRQTQKEERLVRDVRETQLYGHLYPMLRRNRDSYIESVFFHRDAVVLRMVEPIGKEVRFTFARHGLDTPTEQTLFALSQTAMVDLPMLRDPSHYAFRTHPAKGVEPAWYEYQIRMGWKAELLRDIARKRRDGLL